MLQIFKSNFFLFKTSNNYNFISNNFKFTNFNCKRFKRFKRFMANANTKRVLVPIADGSEDIEAVTIIDTLRRAKLKVVVAAASSSETVTCTKGTKIVADKTLDNQDFDSKSGNELISVVLPGGSGAKKLAESPPLKQFLTSLKDKGKRKGLLIGAICAASPDVLDKVLFPVLEHANEITITTHTMFKDNVSNSKFKNERVAVAVLDEDGKVKSGSNDVDKGRDFVIVTSQSQGTALEFSIKIVELLCGQDAAKEAKSSMITNF